MDLLNPLSYVGIPDWRSAVVAVVFTLPWLALLGWGWLRRGWFWAAVAIGALLFPFTIAWVQVPIQSLLSALWVGVFGVATVQQYAALLAIPSLLAASLVQEGTKLLVAIVALRRLGEQRNPRAGLALGAAAGAGYGGFEAFWVFNLIFASGFSLAMVQLSGLGALLGFVERFFTVPFHIGAAALSGYGYTTGRTLRFLLLAVGLHTIGNYGVVLLQTGVLDAVGVEVWVAILALVTIGGATWLRWRVERARPPGDE